MYKKTFIIILSLISLNLFAFENAKQFRSVDMDSVLANSSKTNKFIFPFPKMELLDHNNKPINLSDIFDEDKNVVFAFFYTHCVSICTTVTLSLKSIQKNLPEDTQIVMISIDPETDTPDILANYAKMHKINNSNWTLVTGDTSEIIELQKNFEAYRGNKMNHSTSLFVKRSNTKEIIEIKSNFFVIPQIFNKLAKIL